LPSSILAKLRDAERAQAMARAREDEFRNST
jgi:hypothetical protein